MKNSDEKQLIEVNKKSIFYKIKMFFTNLFKKKEKEEKNKK